MLQNQYSTNSEDAAVGSVQFNLCYEVLIPRLAAVNTVIPRLAAVNTVIPRLAAVNTVIPRIAAVNMVIPRLAAVNTVKSSCDLEINAQSYKKN